MIWFFVFYVVMGLALGVLWLSIDECETPWLAPLVVAFWPIGILGVALIAAIDTWWPAE